MKKLLSLLACLAIALSARAQINGGGSGGGSISPAGGGANASGTYLVQTATNAPVNAQIMAALGTGLVYNTTSTGVQSIFQPTTTQVLYGLTASPYVGSNSGFTSDTSGNVKTNSLGVGTAASGTAGTITAGVQSSVSGVLTLNDNSFARTATMSAVGGSGFLTYTGGHWIITSGDGQYNFGNGNAAEIYTTNNLQLGGKSRIINLDDSGGSGGDGALYSSSDAGSGTSQIWLGKKTLRFAGALFGPSGVSITNGTSGTNTITAVGASGAESLVLTPTTSTASSGTTGNGNYGVQILTTTNQTSTAGYTDFYLNRTNTASGSGTQLLMNLAVGGTSQVKADTTGDFTVTGTFTKAGGTYLLQTSTSLTDNSSTNAATLTNGPTVGNPTKWIAINDNGTTRYIPAW